MVWVWFFTRQGGGNGKAACFSREGHIQDLGHLIVSNQVRWVHSRTQTHLPMAALLSGREGQTRWLPRADGPAYETRVAEEVRYWHTRMYSYNRQIDCEYIHTYLPEYTRLQNALNSWI